MTYDRSFLEKFIEEFGSDAPTRPPRERAVSKQLIVSSVRPQIDEWRAAGHALDAIAKRFTALGVPMSLATLRTCLRRCEASTPAALPRSSRTRRAAARGRSRPGPKGSTLGKTAAPSIHPPLAPPPPSVQVDAPFDSAKDGDDQSPRPDSDDTRKPGWSTQRHSSPNGSPVPRAADGRRETLDEADNAVENSTRSTNVHPLVNDAPLPEVATTEANGHGANASAAAAVTRTKTPADTSADDGADSNDGSDAVRATRTPQFSDGAAKIARENDGSNASGTQPSNGPLTRSPTAQLRVGNIGFVPRR